MDDTSFPSDHPPTHPDDATAGSRPLSARCGCTCTQVPVAEATPPSFFESISDSLKWLADRWAPFAALTIGVSAFIWADFLREFGLPISFTSGSVLAALPAIFSVVCGTALVLFMYFVFPGLVLVTPIVKDGQHLTDLMQRPKLPADASPGESKMTKAEKTLLWYWVLAAAVDTLLWGAVIWFQSRHPTMPIAWGVAVLFIAAFVQSLIGRGLTSRLTGIPVGDMRPFLGWLFLAHLLQTLIGFFVLDAVLHSTTGTGRLDVTVAFITMVVAMSVIAIAQILFASKVARGWYPNVLKHGVCLTFAVLAAISIAQPVGARLASFALVSTATSARLCTVFDLREEPKDSAFAALVVDHAAHRTRHIQFVFPSDGQFYLRRHDDPHLLILDGKSVVATSPCLDSDADEAKRLASAAKAPESKITGPSARTAPQSSSTVVR